jgi:probable rRNA maturation factor
VIEIEADAPSEVIARVAPLLEWACHRLEVERASLGFLIVDAERMTEINHEYRDKPEPTDVLAFPVDGPELAEGWPDDGPPPELGDIVICPAAAEDPIETLAIHGLLHLLGYDHEVDDGEMLALQDELLSERAAETQS